jgi:hypothetical protein
MRTDVLPKKNSGGFETLKFLQLQASVTRALMCRLRNAVRLASARFARSFGETDFAWLAKPKLTLRR